MRINDLAAVIKRKHRYKKPNSKENNIVKNILNRKFSRSKKDEVWVTDITYIQTFSGWAYLCVFLDLFSRKIVGWAVSKNPDTYLVLKAFNVAIRARRPSEGLMVHSDQGCQYTSNAYMGFIKANGFIQSMSRRGNCWDNACVESFFGNMKSEIIFESYFYSVEDVKLKIFEHIECFYNKIRRHSSCGNLSPESFEEKNIA